MAKLGWLECCIISGDNDVNKSNTNMNIEREFALALMALPDVILGCATKGFYDLWQFVPLMLHFWAIEANSMRRFFAHLHIAFFRLH